MNRRQAIEKATHLRKGNLLFVKDTQEVTEFESINAAKRASRKLGLTAVALKGKGEKFPEVQHESA